MINAPSVVCRLFNVLIRVSTDLKSTDEKERSLICKSFGRQGIAETDAAATASKFRSFSKDRRVAACDLVINFLGYLIILAKLRGSGLLDFLYKKKLPEKTMIAFQLKIIYCEKLPCYYLNGNLLKIFMKVLR